MGIKPARLWRLVVDELLRENASCGSLLLNTWLISDDGHVLVVGLPAQSAFTHRMLMREDVSAIVDEMVNEVFDGRVVTYVTADRLSKGLESGGAHAGA